ncbi:nitroreductase family protein [Leeuwenhoekiella marinoflava]|uniref:Putative NAD(P)H nitroreductase n=2 Tax=Leeuwenhoekiella marinoflava TaxID=988 RepID=A0A4V1KSK7_9FLAO|nr:nitroreductase [Leeuwenhoekiella marinoflava]RXG32078.1 nitroreductase [Leeuwenhoekiella marinoflava]SHE97234.1 Nitroreductase [Leeuwenhoekiella marinoflava DSM 3653]
MLKEAILNRRSIFPNQFSEKAVTKAQIEELLEAANWAPTHRKTQPWRFKVFKDDALAILADFVTKAYTKDTPADKFSDFKLKKSIQKIETSGAVIAICMQRDVKESIPEWEEVAATAMAVQNLWLMAGELGLGGYWSSPGYIKEMHADLKLEDGEVCLGFFYLGVYDGEPFNGERDTVQSKTTWF